MPLSVGDKLGPYEIIVAIGKGGKAGRSASSAIHRFAACCGIWIAFGHSSWQRRMKPPMSARLTASGLGMESAGKLLAAT
jgi:hypothetical protein